MEPNNTNLPVKKILSNLLSEITSKQNWYAKVFNDEIVHHWKQEFLAQSPTHADDLFDLVIGFAKATAQGSVHREDCQWSDNVPLCDTCKQNKIKDIKANPKDFGFELEGSEEFDKVFEDDDWIYESNFECDHPRCSCVPPDFELHKYVRYSPDGFLDESLRNEIKLEIQQMLDREPVDWHPGSNNQVRDLIHPSMYCYVKGVSKLNNGSTKPSCEEEVRYQWLPSDFNINKEGQVKILSYINNLDTSRYPRMVTLLERAFEAFIPSLEAVVRTSLKDKKLQVITKIGTIYLDPANPNYPGGSWHIEGMPYEHIVASSITYLEVKNISESYLEFRKPVLLDKEDCGYPQSDDKYTTHHYGIEPNSHFEGTMNRYLGLVKCNENTSIVFPNSLQHRVKEFSLIGKEKGIRTILVFFVIDPTKRIVSTADVPPQQNLMSREEAEHHRERLMFHRKYFVNLLNKKVFERPYSLCEH